jgi:hypothetical protein
MDTVEAHVGKMEARLKVWGARFDEVVDEAEGAGTAAKIECRRRIDDLAAKYQAAQWKLEKLRATGSADWETVKAGVESDWDELKMGLKTLTKQSA